MKFLLWYRLKYYEYELKIFHFLNLHYLKNIYKFEEFDKLNEDSIKISHVIREGSPARVILETIEEEDIDLVVIGSSGKTGIDKFLMGSVAEKVVKSAKCSVLVVH